VVADHWLLFYGTAGALFTDMTCKLMVSHVCHQPFRPSWAGTAMFAAAPILLRAG
jgi:hypothetical protein